MPTAKGKISGQNRTFEGHWDVEGRNLALSGNFNKSLGKWSASSATLRYDNSDDLVGIYDIDTDFQPHIGGSNLVLPLKNQSNRHILVIGSLENDLPGTIDLTGQGIWDFSQSD